MRQNQKYELAVPRLVEDSNLIQDYHWATRQLVSLIEAISVCNSEAFFLILLVEKGCRDILYFRPHTYLCVIKRASCRFVPRLGARLGQRSEISLALGLELSLVYDAKVGNRISARTQK